MAGPSGAGMVQSYLRSMRSSNRSRSRDIRAAMRREIARAGASVGYQDPELAPFECFSLCMSCGYLSAPSSLESTSDPMRGAEATERGSQRCMACGEHGLADLRHTPTVYSLGELEEDERPPSRGAQAAKIFVLSTLGVGLLAYMVRFVDGALSQTPIFEGVGPELTLSLIAPVLLPVVLMLGWVVHQARNLRSTARTTPRRWRLARGFGQRLRRPEQLERGVARETGELLRAPISGQPCLAYEVAICEEDLEYPTAMPGSDAWRLVEQDNVAFQVGDQRIPRGEALLRIPRSLAKVIPLDRRSPQLSRFLRMRGLLESDQLRAFEIVVLPGQRYAVGQNPDEPAQLFAA